MFFYKSFLTFFSKSFKECFKNLNQTRASRLVRLPCDSEIFFRNLVTIILFLGDWYPHEGPQVVPETFWKTVFFSLTFFDFFYPSSSIIHIHHPYPSSISIIHLHPSSISIHYAAPTGWQFMMSQQRKNRFVFLKSAGDGLGTLVGVQIAQKKIIGHQVTTFSKKKFLVVI